MRDKLVERRSHRRAFVIGRFQASAGQPGAASGGSSDAEQVGRYRIVSQLAAGGMGVVYHAVDEVTERECALKRIKPEFARDRYGIEAFEREYRVLAGIDHPRIIRVYEYGVDEVGPYYTMELVEGDDLHKRAPIDYREVCLYLRDVAASLALLHARRLLHRDLSPRNVRVTPDGRCKLLDFGALSGFGPTSIVVGTPPSVAPEAARGAPLDQRTDLYALGALAYWLLTRQHAYPAKRIDQLPELWERTPVPPSALLPGIPQQLDELVMGLLAQNPLARPASAAAVIAKLNVIGELPADDDDEVARVATSFLSTPSFVGRRAELDALRARVVAMIDGRGCAVEVEAGAGLGRTRLLEEVGVLAQLAGACVLRVDASMHRQPRGTLRALALRLLDLVPASAELAAQLSAAVRAELDVRDGTRSLRRSLIVPSGKPGAGTGPELTLEEWITRSSGLAPLLLQIDNAEYADDASLGSLAALARGARERRLMIVFTHRPVPAGRKLVGLSALQAHCTRMTLDPLTAHETLQLARSLFGEAANLARFADYLYARAAGNPLHCLEISRQLVAKRAIRYLEGNWALPNERPEAAVPGALDAALCARIDALSPAARRLAEGLSLHRGEVTPALCQLLAGADQRVLYGLLDELARNDVLHHNADGLRWSSVVLRETLLSEMDDGAREVGHARLGEALLTLARRRARREPAQLIEAGYHLLQGGDDSRGADLIAQVASDSVACRLALADLHTTGTALEAALKVYRRQRRSPRERLPLLGALAQAGYYEDRRWGDLYGDEALDTLEDVCGLSTARRLGRFLGRTLGLVLGIGYAYLRFRFAPRRERGYPFGEALIQLFGAVTCLTAIAVLALDAKRARAVADTLEPFAGLPERLTPVGIYQFCQSLRQIALEDQARAFQTFDLLSKRFRDPRYYPTLPDEARTIYVAGAHFARGVFASFKASGNSTLEDADALDALNLKYYAMIASELRFLYYMNRGDYARAAEHRQQVDIHAAHVGSAWQVETWEPVALIPVYCWLQDIDGLTRVADRLEELAQGMPSLRHYARLARWARGLVLADATRGANAAAIAALEQVEPRSYIGWAAHMGFTASGSRILGNYAVGARLCRAAQAHITDQDREYVALFLIVDIEAAYAEAVLGQPQRALDALDALLRRHGPSQHPLALGLLHEARALIAHAAQQRAVFEESAREAQRWLRPMGTPALIAKCERLVRLHAQARPGSGRRASEEVERWLEMLDGYAEPAARAVHGLELLRHASRAEAAAFYRRVGNDFTLYAQTGRGSFDEEPAPELRAALSESPDGPAAEAGQAASCVSQVSPVELAANNGTECRAYLLLDEQGVVSGAVALSAPRQTRVPPQALLVALSRALAEEASTEVASVADVTKRSPIAS